MAIVVSVVSGKGGSGKSLLTAVLGRAIAREGARVLLVDMDIFVRGLTVLLFEYKRPERDGRSITVSDLLGIFPSGSEGKSPLPNVEGEYMIQRFFECDVLPAVDNIAAPLDYDDKSLSDEEFAVDQVRRLVSSVSEKYDYVVLDNRAGMDSLIAASCRSANIVLAVAEDDVVGRQTNINLTRFLQSQKNVRVIYTILNKGRNIRNYPDLKERSRHRSDFATLGVIPFDVEILEDFGSDRFWATVFETLYFRALIDAWNQLSKSESVTEISVSKYRFPPKIFMRPAQGRSTLIERMLRLYSLLFTLAGAVFWLYWRLRNGLLSNSEMIAIMSVVVGIFGLWLSTSGVLPSFVRRGSEEGESAQQQLKDR
jgi:septum site-determining protein MinD